MFFSDENVYHRFKIKDYSKAIKKFMEFWFSVFNQKNMIIFVVDFFRQQIFYEQL